jgi:hypothetical protein
MAKLQRLEREQVERIAERERVRNENGFALAAQLAGSHCILRQCFANDMAIPNENESCRTNA